MRKPKYWTGLRPRCLHFEFSYLNFTNGQELSQTHPLTFAVKKLKINQTSFNFPKSGPNPALPSPMRRTSKTGGGGATTTTQKQDETLSDYQLDQTPRQNEEHLTMRMILYSTQAGSQSLQLKQGCIFRLTCSHPELTEDHVLTSAYVKIFTRNAVNKSV